MSILSSCGYFNIRWNVATKESNWEKNDGFWLLWGIFHEYIEQNIITEVLRKAIFHSADICKLMQNQSCKKDQRATLIQIFIVFRLWSCQSGFKKKECIASHRIFFTPRNKTYRKPLLAIDEKKAEIGTSGSYTDYFVMIVHDVLFLQNKEGLIPTTFV